MLHNTSIHSVKKEAKYFLVLGLPLVISQIIYASSNFIGTAMVAQLGENALAASVLVSMIWMSLSVFFFGILNAVSVLVAHQYGAKNANAISKIMGQSYLLGGGICILLILALMCVPFILRLSMQPVGVLHLAIHYVHSLLWTIPGLVTLIISEQFLAAIGRSKIVLRISFLVVPIEIPLIYLFIFGKLGFPACGIAGVGYGFACTYTLSSIGLVIYLITSKCYARYQIFAGIFKMDWHYLKKLIRVGMPIGLMHVIEVGAFAIITFLIARFGTIVLAAHQIAMQYLGFAVTLVFAMAQAVTIRVGHAVGRKDVLGATYAAYTGMCVSVCCVLLIALAFMTVPTFFFQLDMDVSAVNNVPLMHQATTLLFICGVLLLFDNFRIIGFGALQGLKDSVFPMYISFIGFWLIGLTLACFLGFFYHWQGNGIWWGLTIGIASGAMMIVIRLQWILQKLRFT